MIKKINVALAVAFAVLLALKGLKSLAPARSAAPAAAPAAEKSAEAASALAPHVYYFNWPNFSVENPVANRNGVLLDTIKAVFPNAVILHMRGNVPHFAKILREDPRAVVVGYGRHILLDDSAAVSEMPMAYSKAAVMTLRSNPWRYKGPASLAGLKIAANDDFLDYPLVKRAIAARESGGGEDLPEIVVMPDSLSMEDLCKVVESGGADAFLASSDSSGRTFERFSHVMRNFRASAPVDEGDVLLHVSKLDPEFAAAVIADYEAGMLRIEASGERRRIFAYYGFIPRPISGSTPPAP
jgi:hypothetical protein